MDTHPRAPEVNATKRDLEHLRNEVDKHELIADGERELDVAKEKLKRLREEVANHEVIADGAPVPPVPGHTNETAETRIQSVRQQNQDALAAAERDVVFLERLIDALKKIAASHGSC